LSPVLAHNGQKDTSRMYDMTILSFIIMHLGQRYTPEQFFSMGFFFTGKGKVRHVSQ